MTFIVSPIIGVASGFLLKEFDEKSDVQSINRTSGAGPKSAQPDKLGPPDASNKDVTQGMLSFIPGASLLYHDLNGCT